MRNHTRITLGSLFLACAVPAGWVSAQQAPPRRAAPTGAVVKQMEFRDAMRQLWAEHVIWTRQFIVSAAANLPDQTAATERLLENQEDLGDAIKPYYGDEAGTRLTALLKEHITIAADVVKAAKADQSAKMDAANQRWVANADTIAAFLSRANSRYWRAEAVRDMMRQHLDLTLEEASARLKGDWKADIDAYGKVFEQAMDMADALSDGIIRQFPGKFDSGVAN